MPLIPFSVGGGGIVRRSSRSLVDLVSLGAWYIIAASPCLRTPPMGFSSWCFDQLK